MKALIDYDIIVHRVGFTTEDEGEGIARYRCDEMLDGILSDTKADEFEGWLSDSTENGFRRRIYPQYKANRMHPKPKHYDFLKEYLITHWAAKISYEQEADDSLGINQEGDSVICTIDKDLNQIPGNHYNFVTKKWHYVLPEEGVKFFYKQLLMGDAGENVKGVWRIGEKKADKILSSVDGEKFCFLSTVEAYRDWLSKEWKVGDKRQDWTDFHEHQMLNLVLMNGRVLKIRQEEGEMWNFPKDTYEQPVLVEQN